MNTILSRHSTADGKWRHQRRPDLGIYESPADATAYLPVLVRTGAISMGECSIYTPDTDYATTEEVDLGTSITHQDVLDGLAWLEEEGDDQDNCEYD